MRTPCHRQRPSPPTARFLWLAAAVTVAGLALRLGVLWELRGLPAVVSPASGTDMATYRQLAADILGGRLPEQFYYQPFYYAVFLPVVGALSAGQAWAIGLAQALLGAATVWLTALTAARLFGRRAGLAAAVGLALARLPIFFTPFALLETLMAFLLAAWVWLLVRAWHRNRWPDWLAAAATGSAAILTRGNALLLWPAAAALLLWRNRVTPRRAVALLATVAMVTWLPQLPFSLRNLHQAGRWTGPSAAQDAVLALGNTPEAPPGGLAYPPAYHEWMRRASLPGPDRAAVPRQVAEWLRREPWAWPELKLRTLLLFWNPVEIANNISLEWDGRASTILHAPLLLGLGPIHVLGLAGLLFALWGRGCRSPCRLYGASVVVVYCGATVLFYVLDRFRLPLVPTLCVFGGWAVDRLWADARRAGGAEHRRRLLFRLLVAALAALLVYGAFPLYQTHLEGALASRARPLGVHVLEPDRLTVHDHGPSLFGGWTTAALPPQGLRFEKTLRLGPTVGRRVRAARVRLAVLAPEGGRVRLEVDVNGLQAAPAMVESELRPAEGLQWLEVRLDPAQVWSEAWAARLRLTPLTAPLFLVVDQCRDYGRTRILPDSGPATVLAAEACLELVLELAP